MNNKYQLRCTQCGEVIPDFATWLSQNQQCKCGCKRAVAEYSADYHKLDDLLKAKNPDSFYIYSDFLPIKDANNAVSYGEGTIPMEEWAYLEKIAKEQYGIDCKVMVYRNDLNGGTGTFKDVAASLAATIFKENGVKEFCVASTGNTATAYSRYLAKAGIKFTVFVPNCVSPDTVREIKSHGQNVVVADGDYAYAKKLAADFHTQNNVLISAGNIDPIRVEAKKTMVFEFLRQLGKMPDVYVQAVAGGTGPIAVEKGVREVEKHYPEVKLPRMLLIQQDTCDPMVQGWENAKKSNFPEGYQNHYPVIDNPQTMVSILSTGNPGMFPVVAPIVRRSGGDFLRVKESELVATARQAYEETNVLLGPAGVVCLAGFFEALRQGQIHNGETVLVNTGEGAGRATAFAAQVRAK
ncbi:MAG: pyridoxal-phosphate dependent enzyme [Bacteroidales bacterium]|nr:pyridoxal-phosphate dependent enzyme [Bacteroidales bacterium]